MGWANEEVINSAGMMLGALVVGVEGMLSGRPGPQGLQANVVAHLLVLGVHGAVCLHGGHVFRVEGGIPVPPNDHGLPQGFVLCGLFLNVLVDLFLCVGFFSRHVDPNDVGVGPIRLEDGMAEMPS